MEQRCKKDLGLPALLSALAFPSRDQMASEMIGGDLFAFILNLNICTVKAHLWKS